jgi:hypothetical protein
MLCLRDCDGSFTVFLLHVYIYPPIRNKIHCRNQGLGRSSVVDSDGTRAKGWAVLVCERQRVDEILRCQQIKKRTLCRSSTWLQNLNLHGYSRWILWDPHAQVFRCIYSRDSLRTRVILGVNNGPSNVLSAWGDWKFVLPNFNRIQDPLYITQLLDHFPFRHNFTVLKFYIWGSHGGYYKNTIFETWRHVVW